jgi:hypothetical protein
MMSASFRDDKNGQQLGYFYYEQEPSRRTAARLLTRDEACNVAGEQAILEGVQSSRNRDDTGRACKALQRFGSGLLRGPKFYAGEIEQVVNPRGPTGMAGCGRRVV